MTVTVDELAIFCKKKGLVFPTAEIYGGLQGFYDYGPLGVELKNNIKRSLWEEFVTRSELVVGIDGSIITHPVVWHASEHAQKFSDIMSQCVGCGTSTRADTLLEEACGVKAEGKSIAELSELFKQYSPKCPKCGKPLKELKEFKLMFETTIGAEKGEKGHGFLRPETAQLIFADFKSVFQSSRLKLPFGIAQMGKAFRNEISPRNFLFRLREFEQFEIEFFVDPEKLDTCPQYEPLAGHKFNLASENGDGFETKTLQQLLKMGVFASKWHAYWVARFYEWFVSKGVSCKNLRLKPHSKEELAHYAKACVDIEYKFPFGWKELHGNADRGTFDLGQHQKYSRENLEIFDEASGRKFIPYVAAEPSQGIERALLVILFDAYSYDEKRGNVVLRLHPTLAPIKTAVFPLVKKDGLDSKAKGVYQELKECFPAFYDESGSIGRRYARQDEIGTPFCITIDYDTLKDECVTVRDRDTTEQVRVKIAELKSRLFSWIYCGEKFDASNGKTRE